jgi:pyridoxamine 5'-phosphate oxidase
MRRPRQYTRNPPLDERDLLPDPLAQFERWLTQAGAAGLIEPTAMTLATVDGDGRPHARMVLFKGLERGGFSFYTNYASAKGREIAARTQAALVFWWDKLERQVRIEGAVQKLPRAKADAYFHSRPRISQLSAAVSAQSQVVSSRAELIKRYETLEAKCEDKPIPLPKTWGGYRVVPDCIEFWQGQPGRLHDRLRYRRAGKRWLLERLEP